MEESGNQVFDKIAGPSLPFKQTLIVMAEAAEEMNAALSHATISWHNEDDLESLGPDAYVPELTLRVRRVSTIEQT